MRVPFIRSGYRVQFGPAETLRSLFEVHNESGNIWTHLMFLLVVFLAVGYVSALVCPSYAYESYLAYLTLKDFLSHGSKSTHFQAEFIRTRSRSEAPALEV